MASAALPHTHPARPHPPSHNLVSNASPAEPVSTSPAARSSQLPSGSAPSRSHSQSPFRYVHTPHTHGARLLSGDPAPPRAAACQAQTQTLPLATLGRALASAAVHKPAAPALAVAAPAAPSNSAAAAAGGRGGARAQGHGAQAHAHAHPGAADVPPRRPHCPAAALATPPARSSSLWHAQAPKVLLQPSRGVKRLLLCERMKPWVPLAVYVLSSLGFLVAITMWKVEVFRALDELSQWLQSQEYVGDAILFFLIFLTTFPPLPLYSTLTVLAGYTFGAWHGAVLSYCAALCGAFAVFTLSRSYFRAPINRCLAHTASLQRAVRAIEQRPKLLFLIRLAPYPYNVMNALLAGSPTLSLRTYMCCTALSLLKIIVHTSIGASIHSFADFHVVPPEGDGRLADGGAGTGAEDAAADADDDAGGWLHRVSTVVGIALCVVLAVYLSYVARRAVDEELEHDAAGAGAGGGELELEDNEDEEADERAAFLRRAPSPGPHAQMAERAAAALPTHAHAPSQQQHPARAPDKFARGPWEEASVGVYAY